MREIVEPYMGGNVIDAATTLLKQVGSKQHQSTTPNSSTNVHVKLHINHKYAYIHQITCSRANDST